MTFKPLQQYKIAVTGTASTSQAIAEYDDILTMGLEPQAVIYAKTCDIVYKFSDASATADATATSNKLVAGNVLVPVGAIFINMAGANLSAISEDEASTGTLFVTIGYNEDI